MWLRLEPSAFEFLEFPAEGAAVVERWTLSRSDGRFEFLALPSGPGSTIQVRDSRGGEAAVDVPLQDAHELLIRLDPPAEVTYSVIGHVAHPDGTPASGASVQLGERNSTHCDADGGFSLEVHSPFEDESLLAYEVGYQPAIVRDFGRSMHSEMGTVSVQRIVLGPPTLTIRGRLEDSRGQGLAGWSISIASGGLELTAHQIPPVLAEHRSAPQGPAKTDEQGAFELRGLREGTYDIEASDPVSLASVASGPVKAGTTDLVLRLEPASVIPMVRGRVTARDGTALAGVAVRVAVVRRYPAGVDLLEGATSITDASGRFALENVARRNLALRCTGARVVEELFPIPPDSDLQVIELTVVRKLAVRIEAHSVIAQQADAIRLEDGHGRLCFIHLPGGFGGAELALELATASLVSVAEDARFAVLLRAGVETLRVPLRLDGPEPIRLVL